MSYADRTKRPPRTLSDEEQRKLLKASGEHADTFRDHVIFSLALGTGLREGEIAALNLGNVVHGKKVVRMIQLEYFARKGNQDNADPGAQRVHLPDGTYYKLEKYVRTKWGAMLEHAPRDEALFSTRQSERLSVRRIRELFREWQEVAGFDHLYTFHELRHTAITNVYRKTRDIRIAQRVARHARIDTTTRYEHASDQEVANAVRGLAS